ncbi:uncharacterized protein [Drosophila bipectinata]|uniref:uncharacterized protein n=1 Tax=Drosophila bipectinata TaxID=42026 RepID=UPI0038B35D71
MMPTKHSPRRSPRLEASGVLATATTTATATGTATSSASVAGDRQRPQTPKESGTAARKAASNLQPEATGQTTDSTTVVATLMERIARLESELAKARASGGQADAARDPVGIGARGVGVSGAANTPPCSSGTLPHHGVAPRQSLSENLPRQMRDNLQTDLGVTPSLQLPAQVSANLPPQWSANLPPQWSANLAPTLGGRWANGQPVSTTTILRYSPPSCVTAAAQPVLGYVHPEVPAPLPISYRAPTTSIQGWMPRRLPDLPDFEGQPEEWPIFLCAFTETTAAYQCTELENNQRLVKALKGEARETVKSLLIHPSNVQAVMEQLRFRYGRPEQLIRSQLESVREVQPIQEANIARIKPFTTKVSNLSAFLQSTATGSQHLANPTLMEELIAKLPLSKRLDWARHAATIQPYPTVAHLSDVREEERYVDRPRCCPICEGQHQVRDCKDFISASTTTRIESARKQRLCFSCLEPGHMSRFCRKSRGCNVLGCQMRHHHLLHEVPKRSKRPPVADGGHRRDQDRQPYRDGNNRRGVPRSVDSSERNHPTSAAVVDARRERDEGILPLTLYGENTKVDTYALLDEGSSVTLIDDELIRSLNLKGESRQLNVQWFGGKSAKEHTKVVSLQISAAGKPKRHGLKNVYGVANLNLPMQSLRQEDVQAVKANTRLPVMPYNNATPRILIGLDHAHLGVPFRTKSYGSGRPFAADTALGWVVYGPVNGKPSSPLLSSCLLAVPQDDLLEKMVSDYFETENFGAKPVQPVAAGRVDLEPSVGDSGDARALSTLEKTTKRVGQRYETGLLWKDDKVRLPESYSMALRRLVNIERKMKRDVDFASAYIRIMDDYVKKGYARRLQEGRALAINEYHYVDDYVDSFASEDEAIAISTRVREIHAEAGFDLCRFTSSSASVVRALNPLEPIASVG